MSDNTIAPQLVGGPLAEVPQVETIRHDAPGGPVLAYAANSKDRLETAVIDVVAQAPEAFPPRTVDKRVVTDRGSFLAEIDRRALIDNVSTVWGNRNNGTITVIYDELSPNAERQYNRRGDQLQLQFIRSEDWRLFQAATGKLHTQDEFGDLLQSVGHLIVSHTAADLLEIVDSIRATSAGSFESRINRANGSQTLSYSEEVNASAGRHGQLEVPRTVVFTAQPFEDYPEFEIAADLRLRVSGNKLGLGLFPEPYDHKIRAAWLDVTDSLSEVIGVPIYAANL